MVSWLQTSLKSSKMLLTFHRSSYSDNINWHWYEYLLRISSRGCSAVLRSVFLLVKHTAQVILQEIGISYNIYPKECVRGSAILSTPLMNIAVHWWDNISRLLSTVSLIGIDLIEVADSCIFNYFFLWLPFCHIFLLWNYTHPIHHISLFYPYKIILDWSNFLYIQT